jgi:NAD(P)-dependent dehydrogenase (short-subunit alcohol dehydrogenase family)
MQVGIILGASGAIGSAVAKAFAGQGYALVLCGRDARRLNKVLLECQRLGSPRVEAAFGDFTQEADYRRLLILGQSIGPPPSFVFYAIGAALSKPLHETSLEEWNDVMGANLHGLFICAKVLLPVMPRGGLFAAITSVAGRSGIPNWSAYSASKGGASAFLRVIREEYRPHGIRVLEVVAGATRSELWDAIPGNWDLSKMVRPEDIAGAVLTAARATPPSSIDEILIAPASGQL